MEHQHRPETTQKVVSMNHSKMDHHENRKEIFFVPGSRYTIKHPCTVYPARRGTLVLLIGASAMKAC